MIEEALAQIDLDRYFELAAHLLPNSATLWMVCDGCCIGSAGDVSASIVEWLENNAAGWGERETAQRYKNDELIVVSFPFLDHASAVIAQLVVSFPRDEDHFGESVIELLAPTIECVKVEMRLASELLVMAEELTARYEELNLVYDTQDQASDYEDTQNQLKVLVDNCRDYLNVSFAALVLREKTVMLYDVDPDLDPSEAVVALDELQGQLYDWIVATKQIAVVNNADDKLGAVLCSGVGYRITAAPVLSGSNEVSGMLVIARSYSQPDFTNNDKNLLDVMSRKASKLVQATYDSLTSLVKRSGFEFQVNRALQSSKVVGMSHALFVVDVDRMQVINDTLGYEAGDMVLKRLSSLFEEQLRVGDTVARLGGDEFGVLVHNCQLAAAKKVALKLADSVEALQLVWGNSNIDASISVGVTPITAEHSNVDGLIAAAEVACSSVKERGGNGVSVYRAGDEELVRRQSYMDLVGRIQDTLRSDRFTLYCQPMVPLQSGVKDVHAEVLLRMLDESGEIIPPGLFLPAAERYHLMPAIDRWVVGRAVSMLDESAVFDQHPGMIISVNLSGQTLSDQSFVRYVNDILDDSSVAARNLCFEITETTAISDADQAQRFIAAFQERGVLFALDDFGTGLSTFSYLKQLPVDFLKIDGSFVKEICDDPVAETMVSAINQVGHTMNLKTIGEFVENEAIRERLAALGVDYGQGYGIAKPKPFSDYLADLIGAAQVRNAG